MGGAVAKTSAALGRPLIPWQQLVADIGGEVNDAGLYVYPLVVVLVQRQCGKTTLELAQDVQRALQGRNRRVWNTAQTGMDARQKWGELVDDVLASPLRRFVQGFPKRGAGSESMTFTNGSTMRPHPPTRDALHGRQSDQNDVDEGWSFDEARGADLFQAIVPTQATRPGAQTWVWSAAGDRSSTWLRSLVERGRAGEPGLAYFEWSIPDDADPTDLDTIARYHPGHNYLITMDSLRAAQVALGDKPGEFARAYGNRWTGAGERVIPVAPWLAAQTVAPVPEGRHAFGVAVGVDGDTLWGSIVAAVADPEGRIWWEVLDHRPGRSWLVDRVKGLRDHGQGVAILRNGPAAPVADQLELAGLELLSPPLAEYTAACQDVYDRVTHRAADPETGREEWAPRLLHRRHDGLDSAADTSGVRGVGDGAWVWSRTRSTGDIGPLEAGTLASFALSRTPAPIVLTSDLMVFS